jgi:phosphatidylglycerophosphatase A
VLGLLIACLCAFNLVFYAACLAALIGVGYWAVSKIDLTAQKDPRYIVIDEACGMMVALMGLPLNWMTLVAGFLLFRLFDIVKPFPIRRLERLPGYWGILFDDLGAGLYVWLILILVFGNPG